MSIHVTSHVWRSSKQKGTALLLMLAIADHAHDDGGGAYPSVRTLADKARTTKRNVRLLLPKLEGDGELHIDRGAGPSGCNVYRVKDVPVGGEESSGGDEETDTQGVKDVPAGGEETDTQGVNPASPEPSVEPSVEPSAEPSAATGEDAARPDDVTGRCLLRLKKVQGFPRDEARVARALTELREQHPHADAVKVCEDYEWKHREGGMKTSNHLSRLRNFFDSAEKRAERDRGKVTQLSVGRSQGRGRAVAPTESEYDEAAY